MKKYPALFVGLLCVSTAGPFLRAAGIDAFAVVLWRMLLAGVLFVGWAAVRGELRIARAHLPRIVAGALLLATHFALWVKAFDLTNYASNLVLLVAQPVTAAVLAMELGEPRGRFLWPSLALAIVGLVVVAGGDVALGPRALLGDAMCIAAGLAIALFYFVTREARGATPLPAFMGVTFLVGSVEIAPIVALAGARFVGYRPAAWEWLAALVLVTTVCGHGLMNLAARHVRMFLLNIVIVLEPVIGIAIGALIFPTYVRATTVAGGVLLGVSVVLAFL